MSCLIQFGYRCISGFNTLNQWIGSAVSWLTLFMVAVTFLIVVLRYAFDMGSVPLQESVTYMHALVFMLGAAYTLKVDGHVRVDIFYQRVSAKVQAWIDCIGVLLLLLPVSSFILWSSWGYVSDSWEIHESSNNSGGLPGVFVIKSTIILTAILLILQGISLFLSRLMVACGVELPKELR